MAILAILSIITIFVIIFTAKGMMIVEQAEAVVIERLGQYSRTLHSGINIVFPLIDKAKEIVKDFSDYLEANKDEIEALTIFYKQPYNRRNITFKMIKDVFDFDPNIRVKQISSTNSYVIGLDNIALTIHKARLSCTLVV